MEQRARNACAALIAAALVAVAGGVEAQSEGSDVKKTVDSTIAIEHATQEQKARWAAERNELTARYKTAKASVEFLAARKTAAADRLAATEAAIAELERSLAESKRLERNLEDTLNAVCARLESRVRADLPFLPAERETRLASLRAEIAKPATSGGEKLRRLLEALQVETGYGNEIEVTQERIALGSDTLFVDLMRLGRVSLFWRTTDGKKIGEYDRGTDRWIELPGKYSRSIGLAMQMASRMRPVEIITLPIGRIRP
jgi:seryl-tRNA synthetase